MNRILPKLLFSGFGLVFVVVGIMMAMHFSKINKEAVDVTATISRIEVTTKTVRRNGRTRNEKEHDVYVDYTFEGEEYEDVNMGFYKTGMKEGQTVTVKVLPSNPGQCYGYTGMLFPLLFSGLGFLFFVIGLFLKN
jgi:hypothetical protein